MIHIACNIDSNFTIHCAVTLTSLFANNDLVGHNGLETNTVQAYGQSLRSIVSRDNKSCFHLSSVII